MGKLQKQDHYVDEMVKCLQMTLPDAPSGEDLAFGNTQLL